MKKVILAFMAMVIGLTTDAQNSISNEIDKTEKGRILELKTDNFKLKKVVENGFELSFESGIKTIVYPSDDFGKIDINVDNNFLRITGKNLPFDINFQVKDSNDGSIELVYKNSEYNSLKIYESGFSNFNSMLESINEIRSLEISEQFENQTMACPPCVVIIIGIVVGAAVSHCNKVIEEGVAGCSRNGNCASVGPCSVSCVPCVPSIEPK